MQTASGRRAQRGHQRGPGKARLCVLANRPNPALMGSLEISQIAVRLKNGGPNMLETIVVVLLILWLLGLVTAHTMGGLIHVLLVVAIAVLLIRILQGRHLL